MSKYGGSKLGIPSFCTFEVHISRQPSPKVTPTVQSYDLGLGWFAFEMTDPATQPLFGETRRKVSEFCCCLRFIHVSVLLGQSSECRSGDCDCFLRDCKLETISIVMSLS